MTGPNVDVSGIGMHKDGIVQMEPLTETIRLDFDWRNEEQWDKAARFVWALSRAINSLRSFYAKGPSEPHGSYGYSYDSPIPDTVKKMKLQRELFYPYPQSYKRLGTEETVTVEFIYGSRLDSNTLMFRAKEIGSERHLMIKFTCRYAEEVHRTLAEPDGEQRRWAPELYGCDALHGGWKMVVMEYLDDEHWTTLANDGSRAGDSRKEIENAMQHLWSKGYVHGDLRRPNIFISKSKCSTEVRLIDFDYSGKANSDRYPRDWNYTLHPTDVVPGGLLRKVHDEEMFVRLF
jgi:hypothetical protein